MAQETIGPTLSYAEAATLLGVPVGTLYSWVAKGFVPHIRFGPRHVRFEQKQLVLWVRSRRVGPQLIVDAAPAAQAEEGPR